jgi:hypothetical protein
LQPGGHRFDPGTLHVLTRLTRGRSRPQVTRRKPALQSTITESEPERGRDFASATGDPRWWPAPHHLMQSGAGPLSRIAVTARFFRDVELPRRWRARPVRVGRTDIGRTTPPPGRSLRLGRRGIGAACPGLSSQAVHMPPPQKSDRIFRGRVPDGTAAGTQTGRRWTRRSDLTRSAGPATPRSATRARRDIYCAVRSHPKLEDAGFHRDPERRNIDHVAGIATAVRSRRNGGEMIEPSRGTV